MGTAIGFSALFMAEYNPAGGHITTIENYEKRIPIARDNFERAGRADQIILLEGDAADVLKELSGPYDMIFMDAAKGQYIHFLEDVMRLLAPEGLLVSDNVLQDGDIIESRFAVTRRNRTIHKRMREYLYCLTHHPRLTTSVLTCGGAAWRSAWPGLTGRTAEGLRGETQRKEMSMKRPELLIPASSLEVVKSCDLRRGRGIYRRGGFRSPAKAKNFSMDEMREGIAFAHDHGVKVYVTANILAHNGDLEGVRKYFVQLKEIRPDALIISDPGVFDIAMEICPEIDISHQYTGK